MNGKTIIYAPNSFRKLFTRFEDQTSKKYTIGNLVNKTSKRIFLLRNMCFIRKKSEKYLIKHDKNFSRPCFMLYILMNS